MSAKYEHIHLFVTGRVQGVGYRQATFKTAQGLGLVGWVRNLEDSRVELVARGPADKIEELRRWCERGPTFARVEAVEVVERAELDDAPVGMFEVRR